MGLLKPGRSNGTDRALKELSDMAILNKPHQVDWGSDKVNCYAWAANCEEPLEGKAEPGRASGLSAKADRVFRPDLLIAGAKADGLIYGANSPERAAPDGLQGFYSVALYLSKNGHDHHWYRRDPKTQRWTHKPGPREIRNYGGNDFTPLPLDLIAVNHNWGTEYTDYQFVAYFYVPEEGVRVG